jgi:hypothetical protein
MGGLQEVFGALREAIPGFNPMGGGGRGGRGGGGGQAPLAESGDYRVTLTAGGRTMSQVLRVEKLANAGSGGGFGFEGDDADESEDALLRQFERWVQSGK